MKTYVYTGFIALSALLSMLLLKHHRTLPITTSHPERYCTKRMLQSYEQTLTQIQKDAHPFGHDLKTWINIFAQLAHHTCQHQINYIELKACEHQAYRICLTSTLNHNLSHDEK